MIEEPQSSEVFDSKSPAFSNVTVRRAFIVWLHCGQKFKFREVCNYYHVLEQLEEELSPERRAISRRHEFNLYINRPPTSIYLNIHHPSLYQTTQLNDYFISKVEAIRNDKCVFKHDGFRRFSKKPGVTKKQIVDTSRLIRNYCLSRYITLEKFLNEFELYAKRCKLQNNVASVWEYIQRQLIKDEIVMITNWPVSFSFLDEDDASDSYSTKDSITPNTSFNNLYNQKRLLHSINVCPTMLKDITVNPWRMDGKDMLNINGFNKTVGKTELEKQYRNPGLL